jgi:hypothetical protein
MSSDIWLWGHPAFVLSVDNMLLSRYHVKKLFILIQIYCHSFTIEPSSPFPWWYAIDSARIWLRCKISESVHSAGSGWISVGDAFKKSLHFLFQNYKQIKFEKPGLLRSVSSLGISNTKCGDCLLTNGNHQIFNIDMTLISVSSFVERVSDQWYYGRCNNRL